MILRFQELVKVEGESDSFRTTGNFATYQCTHYDVNRKGRLVLVMRDKVMLAQRYIAPAEYVDVFVMNDDGKTIDSVTFKPVVADHVTPPKPWPAPGAATSADLH